MLNAAPTINYQPQGATLKAFHESKKPVRVIIGPLGSGKTHACIMELLLQMLHQEPDAQGIRRSRIAVVRNSWPDLKNTVISDFNEIIGATGLGQLRLTAPAEWVAEFPVGDGTTVNAEILFLAFDDPNDQRKARGLQLSGIWFNELAELHKANVDLLLSRVGRFPKRSAVPKAKSFVIADTNACDRDHWLAKLTMDATPSSWDVFVQPGAAIKVDGRWQVNTQAENYSNLPGTYYPNLLEAKSDQWIRRNLGNEFVYLSNGRPVHPDFSEQLHVAEVRLDPTLPILIGMDFGRTPAAVFGQQLPSKRWIITHELVTSNMSALRFGEMLLQFIQYDDDLNNAPAYLYTGDPAGTQQAQTRDETVYDVLETVGIYAEPAHTNDFGVRSNTMDALLTKIIDGHPAILIHPRCTTLIKGLAGGYHFRRMLVPGEERYTDKPDKNMLSHCAEAAQYLLMTNGEDILRNDSAWEAMNAELQGCWVPDQRRFE